MAYPRRQSGSHLAPSPRARRNSSDEDVDMGSRLSPPRPFFLAENSAAHRSSSSSIENTSLDPPSDSDEISLPSKAPPRAPVGRVPPRTHARKRSSMSNTAALDSQNEPSSRPNSSYHAQPESPTASATSPLLRQMPPRPPPSSFSFPFQSYPGNPDPGLSIPGLPRRRSSLEMDTMPQDISYPPLSPTGSLSDLRKPYAPFMGENASNSKDSLPRSSSSNSLYKQSAAANMMPSATAASISSPLPNNNSVQSFRAPFLSPASRPNSTLWSPPSYAQYANPAALFPTSPSASTTALPLSGASPFASVVAKSKPPPLPSTRLAAPLAKSEKPWLSQREPRSRLAYFLTYFCIFLGAAGAAIICWTGIRSVDVLDPNSLCLVLDDEFNGSDLDSSTWNKDVELGGFGNGEFEMTTDSSDNLYVSSGELFIMPTVTTAKVADIFQGNYTLQGCTAVNATSGNSSTAACTVVANTLRGTVINPVQSARINTQGKKNIKFGKVEVRAKLPTGDWLWPAVWMLPENNTYGAWPLSGEIDIIEARGNGPTYPAQGSNYVRSTLSYGPLPTLVNRIFGWFSTKRSSFADDFHTYTLEWTENYIRLSVDTVLHAMLTSETKPGQKKNNYWAKAGFPETARNGTDGQGNLVAVEDPYNVAGATRAAPFDQSFYLIIDVAAGGTSGWFPDNEGGKPWFDGSQTAMRDFAQAQNTWYRTWPQSANDRAFRIDYVKMWEQCK